MTPEQCRAERLARSWSEQELARRACLSRGTVYAFEARTGKPTLSTRTAIAAAFSGPSPVMEPRVFPGGLNRDVCRQARTLLGWSVDQLCREAGLRRSTISAFENGRRRPHARTSAAIRDALKSAGVEFASREVPGIWLRKAEP